MTIRKATLADGPALGHLGALLMKVHYDFDRTRFLKPEGDVEAGYGGFLLSQLDDEDAVIFVAEDDGHIIGYCYVGIEPLSWKELRDISGFIHDIAVDAGARRHGVAQALVDAAIDWCRARGLVRVMLWTAARNTGAQALFERAGFRHTMTEMTLDL